jgi:hypothetical protein
MKIPQIELSIEKKPEVIKGGSDAGEEILFLISMPW